ncbi:MAG: hypothetical protein H6557_05795 [Lewinellaceae bacterium]|nr:hypothetical protein [Lewinellaceae bacterium]
MNTLPVDSVTIQQFYPPLRAEAATAGEGPDEPTLCPTIPARQASVKAGHA